ncbi:hypothetical protein BC835DRAFT_1291373, partial [Cytidiella melzeri]
AISSIVSGSASETTSTLSFSVTPSVASQFSGIVTETSLIISLTASEGSTLSLSNPDEPTSGVSLATTLAATAAPSQAPLPNNIPSRIYLPSGMPTSPGPSYTLITLLLDNALPWKLVATNDDSANQIFAWFPVIISTALGIDQTDVTTVALQVFKPTSYTGPQDVAELQTEYLAYIQSDLVDTLANQLLVKTSPFYQTPPPYNQLAAHVLSTFPVASGDDGSGGSGSDSGSGSGNGLSSASSSNKTRENAIIGVISSLGAITVIVLAFLAVRAYKQRRALAHRRLSDPPQGEFVGSRPENQDFDRDTLGHQRRRSFYYAEDSLRGYEDSHIGAGIADTHDQRTEQSMRERRPVNAAMISTPVLRDNTMNW